MTTKDNSVTLKEITDAQKDLLQLCKDVGWGKIEVIVQNGEPDHSRVLEWTHKHRKL